MHRRERKRSGSSHSFFCCSVSRLGDVRSGIVSALCRLRRERKLSTEEYGNAKASVLTDIDDPTVIGITEEVIAHGVAVLEQFSLRSADALHIACAS